jgi:hypothetical protein
MWAPRCNCWRIIFVTYIWKSQVAYGENIIKSRQVPRPHSTLSSEWRNNWRSKCTVYQDGWLAQLLDQRAKYKEDQRAIEATYKQDINSTAQKPLYQPNKKLNRQPTLRDLVRQ